MKIIKNQKKLDEMLAVNHISQYFSDTDLPFQLCSFEKGEYLNNELDLLGCFTFVISGSIRIIHIRDDASMYELISENGFAVLGDIEFASHSFSAYLVEAKSDVLCIALPLRTCRKKLENDPVFLRFLLKSLAEKMDMITGDLVKPGNLRERVIRYMEFQCGNHQLSGVEKASHALGCSKRQLLRILKQLCMEGIVTKMGKGKYLLTEVFGKTDGNI